MNSKTYLHKLESNKYLELKTNEKTFYPTTTSNELINGFKKFQKFEKKIGETLDLGCGVGIVGIVLNHLGLIQSPLYASDLSKNAIELTKVNCKKHGCNVIAKQGSIFSPWKNKKFDYILNDISGVAEGVATISPWFKNVPCESGADGTKLVTNVISNASKHLKPDGVLFFPVLSLSNTDKILTSAKKYFYQVKKLGRTEWPFPETMKKHEKILLNFAKDKLIKIDEKFGMLLWYTEIYFATNCKKKFKI